MLSRSIDDLPCNHLGDEVHTAVGKITVQLQQEKGRGLGCTVQYIQYHSEYNMAPTPDI
jgi:hypothetical protein